MNDEFPEFDESGTRSDVSEAGTWMFFMLSVACFIGTAAGLALSIFS